MIKDFFKIAFKNLKNRQLRSYLTVLGIVISVASIVALLAISAGLQAAIVEQFDKIGSNRLFVMVPGGQPGTIAGLTTKDVETLEKIPDFDYVTPYLMEMSAKIEYSKEIQYNMVIGFPDDDADKRWESMDLDFLDGRSFRDGEKNAVMIGYLVSNDIFDKEIKVGNKILINDAKFEVVGILDEIGNPQDDKQMYIPLDTARDLFNKPDEVNMIDVEVKEGRDLDYVADKAARALERSRNDENFEIMSPMQILEFLDNILGIVKGVLVSIALISLVVGAVGIMNSMYTSVMERTKEIGIMKSIGATNFKIMSLFLIEAGLIGLVGGIVGVALGWGIAYGVDAMATAAGFKLLKITFNFLIVIEGLGYSVFVGMLAGALPSYQASRMKPVDALRWGK